MANVEDGTPGGSMGPRPIHLLRCLYGAHPELPVPRMRGLEGAGHAQYTPLKSLYESHPEWPVPRMRPGGCMGPRLILSSTMPPGDLSRVASAECERPGDCWGATPNHTLCGAPMAAILPRDISLPSAFPLPLRPSEVVGAASHSTKIKVWSLWGPRTFANSASTCHRISKAV